MLDSLSPKCSHDIPEAEVGLEWPNMPDDARRREANNMDRPDRGFAFFLPVLGKSEILKKGATDMFCLEPRLILFPGATGA